MNNQYSDETKPDKNLISKSVSGADSKIVVLFGGSPIRRDEVINVITSNIENVSVYGTLGEEEGMQKVKELGFDKVDLVLIGGRYTTEQRIRIKKWLNEYAPNIKTTEPGVEYPYSNDAIIEGIRKGLSL